MSQQRKRLDALVVDAGFALTGSRAQALIMAGEIRIEGQIADKPGKKFPTDSILEYVPKIQRYVSRGGEKLASALEQLELDVAVSVALDIGASTGGFTDLLLQNDAKKVYAVDVGKGILDYKLRQDSRVVVLEGTNARYLSREQVPEPVDLIVMDVSFISLAHIFPAVLPMLKPNGYLLPMIKPQFEVGREDVPRGGVVRDKSLVSGVLRRIATILYNENMTIEQIAPSAVRGPKGNQEYFLLAINRRSTGDPKLEMLIQKALT